MSSGSVIIEYELFDLVWRDKCVVKDWCDALIVPVPKKGNFKLCDNWRGISLLDVVEEVLGRIVQDRLRLVAEDVLPDSQCRFRTGRGCIDMIFLQGKGAPVRLVILYVHLRKVCDLVSHTALWRGWRFL